jgi:hypothetical protein
MKRIDVVSVLSPRNLRLVFLTVFVILGFIANVWSQEQIAANDNVSKESEVKKEAEKPAQPAASKSQMKVTFDENSPGVIFIESNGEKIRIDANKKTVAQITAPTENTAENPKQQETAQLETKPETKKPEVKPDDKEESVYDFDKGEEPYDYRIVNVPTPKSVPKGSWNLFFTHRFTQPIHPLSESGKNLLGFDSFSVSSFGVTYGITDKLYVSASRSPLCERGLCRTIEVGLGYNWIAQDKDSPFALTTYASIEGNDNFTEEYTYNLQAMLSARLGKRVYLFFSPAAHLNANGQHRFNPRPEQFFPPATIANSFKLPTNGASFGFGADILITHDIVALFDFAPRIGFKLGRIDTIFDSNFNVIGFKNVSYPSIGFGIQKNIGKHSFALTFSNTQTSTTSRYNSSNLVLKPKIFTIGFNLSRRF